MEETQPLIAPSPPSRLLHSASAGDGAGDDPASASSSSLSSPSESIKNIVHNAPNSGKSFGSDTDAILEASPPLDPFLNPSHYLPNSYVSVHATNSLLGGVGNFSIFIAISIHFLSTTSSSIVLPSMWEYLTRHFSKDYWSIGLALGLNSIGSFVGSPLFVRLHSHMRTRSVLSISLSLMIIGQLMYSMSPNYVIALISRFIIGFAASSYIVVQEYLSLAASPFNRDKIMTYNTMANVFGFTFGPIFAALLGWLTPNYKSIRLSSIVSINSYTTPGYFIAAFSTLALLCIVFGLREAPLRLGRSPHSSSNSPLSTVVNSAASQGSYSSYSSYSSYRAPRYYDTSGSIQDFTAILGRSLRSDNAEVGTTPIAPLVLCLLLYAVLVSSFNVWEAVGALVAWKEYHFDHTHNELMFSGMGICGIIALVIYRFLQKLVNDRALLVFGLALTSAGFGLLLVAKGSPSYALFVASIIVTSICYAISVNVLLNVYKKATANDVTLMTWLSSSGAIARILSPILSVIIYQFAGSIVLWITTVAILGIATVLTMFCYRSLAPRESSRSMVWIQ